MDSRLLKAVMVYNDDTQPELAKALGISIPTTNARINGMGKPFSEREIEIIRQRYNLTSDLVCRIFLSDVSLERGQKT